MFYASSLDWEAFLFSGRKRKKRSEIFYWRFAGVGVMSNEEYDDATVATIDSCSL